MSIAIKIENLYKEYRLGLVGSGTLYRDLQTLSAKIRGKEDPNSTIGKSNKNIKGTILALNDINLEVEQGQVLGVIGMNGAGKSTLLKVLSRVTAPTKGSIKYKGRISSLLEVGTGFHHELTGRENIYLNGAINGMNRNEVNARLDEIVDFAGVERFLDTPVKRYSSGMFVRLGFAVAAHLEPDILIVDEVLAVGDNAFKEKAAQKMKDASEGEGRTVLFVSHNMDSIQSICPNALLMSEGSIIEQGDSKAVIGKYLKEERTLSERFQGSRTWEGADRPGNEYIKIRSITTTDKNDLSVSSVEIDEDLTISIEYEVFSDELPIGFSMLLTNNQNVILSSMDEHIDFDWHRQPNHKKGLFTNSCEIKANLLNSGIHNISLWCYSPPMNPNSAPHVLLKDVLSFEIIDNSKQGTARGSFPYDLIDLPATRPKLYWKKSQL